MTEPLQVGQFAIVDFEGVDRGPNAGIFTGKGPVDDRAELYLVAEGTTPAGESFAGHIVSAAGRSFETADMSVTGAIRRVFQEADSSLREWNRKSIAQHRVSLGMSAFARRGNHVVLAQAGPTVAFHLTGGVIDVYVADEEHGTPLGSGERAEPQLRRLALNPGDRLLLMSTSGLANLDDERIGQVLGQPSSRVLPELFRYLHGVRHATAVYLSAGEAQPRRLEPPQQVSPALLPEGEQIGGVEPDYQPSLFAASDDAGRDAEAARRQLVAIRDRIRPARTSLPSGVSEAAPAPLQRAVGDDVSRTTRPTNSATASYPQLVSPRPGITASPEATGRAVTGRRSRSFTRGLVKEERIPAPTPSVSKAPPVDELADLARARAAATVFPLGESAAIETGQVTIADAPLVRNRQVQPRRRRSAGSLSGGTAWKLPPTWAIIVVGVAALIGVVAVLALPGQFRRSDSARFAELIDSAQEKIATARAVPDRGQRRIALVDAQTLLLEARDLSSGSSEATRLLLEVTEDLAAMDAVRAPASVLVVANLDQFGDRPVSASRIAFVQDTGFVLDAASSQVIQVSLSTGEHRVVFREDASLKRGRPIAIAAYETLDLGVPVLLIVDANRNMWSVAGREEARQLTFPAPESVTDIAVFGSELFVLDAAAGAVYRFAPTAIGFGPGLRILNSADLSAARRLNVTADEILTADANGTLHRFAGELALALGASGIDRRLTEPGTPFALGKSGEVIVLDAPNDRLVVVKPDGTFDRQYRHAELSAASAFVIARGKAYVFSGGKLRELALP